MPSAEWFRSARQVFVLSLLCALVACSGKGTQQIHDSESVACGSPSLSSARHVVDKYCVSCHSPNGAASDYDWSDEHALLVHRRNIAAKVGRNSMPPPGQPRPSGGERRDLLCWANQ